MLLGVNILHIGGPHDGLEAEEVWPGYTLGGERVGRSLVAWENTAWRKRQREHRERERWFLRHSEFCKKGCWECDLRIPAPRKDA